MALLRITPTDEALRLEGDIDLAAADQLTEALGEATGSGITVVDVSDVTFLDSTGLHVLLSAANALNGQGPLILRRPSPAVTRILDLAIPGGVAALAVRDD